MDLSELNCKHFKAAPSATVEDQLDGTTFPWFSGTQNSFRETGPRTENPIRIKTCFWFPNGLVQLCAPNYDDQKDLGVPGGTGSGLADMSSTPILQVLACLGFPQDWPYPDFYESRIAWDWPGVARDWPGLAMSHKNQVQDREHTP